MTEFSHSTAPLSSMPILARGKHSNPSQGACFMEYTALLAGETFTDEPRCVDPELAAVLRGANDRMSDADRSRLVPLLGRAIGLAVEPPPKRSGWNRSAAARCERREQRLRYADQTARLRRAVSTRFMSAVGHTPSPATRVWSGHGEDVCWLFWDLMSEPTVPQGTAVYTSRLLDRIHLLHDCYEQSMRELGLPRSVPVVRESVQDRPKDVLPAR